MTIPLTIITQRTVRKIPASQNIGGLARLAKTAALALCGALCLVSLDAQPAQQAQPDAPPPSQPAAQPPDTRTGAIFGTVSNAATKNTLQGARVAIPEINRLAMTDETGSYMLTGIPAGIYEVVVSYMGLNTQRANVNVEPGRNTSRDFELTEEIYQLETMRVVGEREGTALALTMQRNADNVKNVVALDAFGNLPNMSPGELVMRLPGIVGDLAEDGNISGVTVRGTDSSLNRFTIDDGLMSSGAQMTRNFQTQNFTAAMFEQIEVIKGHTPDKGADSLGGTINMKTRSPLSMRGKRRISYNLAARWAPPFYETLPLREPHRLHPLFNVSYQEIFSVLGGRRNLGVALNAFYSENVTPAFRTYRNFQNTTNTPAYLWDYRTQETYNNRQQYNMNLKFEFKASRTAKFQLNTIYNDNYERSNPRYEERAYTGNADAVPNDTTSGVMPGYTETVTQVRPVSGSIINISDSHYSAIVRARGIGFRGEHDLGRLKLDYTMGYNQTHVWMGSGGGGVLQNRLTGVGWILDRTESDLYPSFTQTDGPDFTDPNNYRPPANGLTSRDNKRLSEISDFRFDALYALPVSFPLHVKAGAQRRQEKVGMSAGDRRWSYIGTDALPSVPYYDSWDKRKTGRNMPRWESTSLMTNGEPNNPDLWREDLYYREEQKYVGTQQVTENVTAGYGMIQGRYGKTGFLAGVRTEKTEDRAWGWVRARVNSTPAEQAADPVGAALKDYGDTRRNIKGSYTQSFPSIHLQYDIAPNTKARASWSTSFGRPALNNLVPGESENFINQTLTINNPGLKPQSATNWDFTLEHYFKSVGTISAGWFRKKITDFIAGSIESGTVDYGPDNGYNGDYEGYRILTAINAGTAYIQGWEFSYQQQFSFLPGFLKGLALTANYTILDTRGDFGGDTYLTTGEVAGFVPRTANVSLSWRYRGFSTRILYNRTSNYIVSYSNTAQGANIYRKGRDTINLGLAYQIRPSLSITLDINNLTNEYLVQYKGVPSQMERTVINGVTFNMGVSGRF